MWRGAATGAPGTTGVADADAFAGIAGIKWRSRGGEPRRSIRHAVVRVDRSEAAAARNIIVLDDIILVIAGSGAR